MNKRAEIEVAVESKLIEFDQELRKVLKGEIMSAGSSRLNADEIVDLVLRMDRGEKVEVKKPWEFFKVGKPEDKEINFLKKQLAEKEQECARCRKDIIKHIKKGS